MRPEVLICIQKDFNITADIKLNAVKPLLISSAMSADGLNNAKCETALQIVRCS